MFRPQNRYVRICRRLQRGYTRTHDKHSGQEERKAHHLGGRNKQQASHHLDEQRNHHRPLVSNRLNQLRRRRREHKISEEERRLRQHGPRIRQIENRPQMRNQRHVQVRDKPENEEQHGYCNEGSGVVRRCCGRCRRRSSCHRLFAPLLPQKFCPVRAVVRSWVKDSGSCTNDDSTVKDCDRKL